MGLLVEYSMRSSSLWTRCQACRQLSLSTHITVAELVKEKIDSEEFLSMLELEQLAVHPEWRCRWREIFWKKNMTWPAQVAEADVLAVCGDLWAEGEAV
jgi:hypothetical protein